ncbi:MAG: hypothetical protein RL678_1323, partial [Pseudomonadota bacterium]
RDLYIDLALSCFPVHEMMQTRMSLALFLGFVDILLILSRVFGSGYSEFCFSKFRWQ